MTSPQEISWLEDHHQIVVRLAGAKQELEAWVAHHGRAAEGLKGAEARVTLLEGELSKHETTRPEPEEEAK